MRKSELFRSILYIPGSNTKALEKAKGLDCDGLIFDLEDAVIPEKKDEARVAVKKYLTRSRQTYGNKKIIVRVNSCDTVWGEEDFISAVDMAPDAILLPKISSAGDFISGVGYAMATDEADSPGTTLDFTGTIYYSDRTVSIDDQTSTLNNYGKFKFY